MEEASYLTGVVLDDIAESLESHLGEAEPLGMLLGLHFVALTHGEQRVEVLGLGAHEVQKTCCEGFGVLQHRWQHIIASTWDKDRW